MNQVNNGMSQYVESRSLFTDLATYFKYLSYIVTTDHIPCITQL